MTYEQIKEDHQFCTITGETGRRAFCSCGDARYPWATREESHEMHFAEMFEQALRTQIAADIRATFSDPERLRPRDPEGKFATDLLNDWQWAARIAEEGNPK